MDSIDIKEITQSVSEVIFYGLIVIFVLHAIMLAYHWFAYGENKKISTLALGIYLIGGGILFLILGISISSI